MPSHFKVKEYCPNVFRNLREKFGVSDADYLVRDFLHVPVFLSVDVCVIFRNL